MIKSRRFKSDASGFFVSPHKCQAVYFAAVYFLDPTAGKSDSSTLVVTWNVIVRMERIVLIFPLGKKTMTCVNILFVRELLSRISEVTGALAMVDLGDLRISKCHPLQQVQLLPVPLRHQLLVLLIRNQTARWASVAEADLPRDFLMSSILRALPQVQHFKALVFQMCDLA